MVGNKNIIKILIGAGLVFQSSTLFAFDSVTVTPENIRTIALDKTHQISGAHATRTSLGETVFVVKENDPIVYRVIKDATGKKAALEAIVDLTKLKGQYRFAQSFIGKNYDLEGITACKADLYTVNESSADIIKSDMQNVTKMQVNSENFPDYQYNPGSAQKDGFIGITADCAKQVLYVAKQNNPNMVFVVSLVKKDNEGKNLVVGQFNLSGGSNVDDDISDLFFYDSKIYVLQKNMNSIVPVDPTLVCDETVKSCMVGKYDFSAISAFTTAPNSQGDSEGIAEALTVSTNPTTKKHVFTIYQDQRKNNPKNNDKSKDAIFKFEI